MKSFSTSLTKIPTLHQDLVLKKKESKIIIYNDPQKFTFKMVSLKTTCLSKSNFSKTTKGVLTSLASSLNPVLSEISNMIAYYLAAIRANFFTPPLHPSVDPEIVLTGNFAPVGEMAPTECFVVEGEIPLSLNGAYIRNGPNPQYKPVGPHHLWSGDGMLHSIRLQKGHAIFCSRYVETYKYKLEREKGHPVIQNVVSGFYSANDLCKFISNLGSVIAERVNLIAAFGLANTSLAFFHGSLFALMDGDLPYRVRLTDEGDIETLDRYDFSGDAPLNMNAHPKFDAETKELYGFQLHAIYPYLTYFRFDGSNRENVPIFSVKGLSYVHDFAITKRYAIFPDIQLEISLYNLFFCKGIPLSYDANKISRIGIILRYATSDANIRWFPVPGLNAFHFLNAWEENDEHVIIITPTISSPDKFLYKVDDFHMYLEKITIDMKTGEVSRNVLSKQVVEMGSINPTYSGKKNRYAYMAINRSSLKMCGVVKIDLELECEVASKFYGPGYFGGEAYFVPKSDTTGSQPDEDDGFVVSFVHNETNEESFFMVLDAKSLEFVGKVKLPGRVPYGFHGIFVCEDLLENI